MQAADFFGDEQALHAASDALALHLHTTAGHDGTTRAAAQKAPVDTSSAATWRRTPALLEVYPLSEFPALCTIVTIALHSELYTVSAKSSLFCSPEKTKLAQTRHIRYLHATAELHCSCMSLMLQCQ